MKNKIYLSVLPTPVATGVATGRPTEEKDSGGTAKRSPEAGRADLQGDAVAEISERLWQASEFASRPDREIACRENLGDFSLYGRIGGRQLCRTRLR